MKFYIFQGEQVNSVSCFSQISELKKEFGVIPKWYKCEQKSWSALSVKCAIAAAFRPSGAFFI